ncbi:MAG: DMT family transporter [Chloroflexota bacterium]
MPIGEISALLSAVLFGLSSICIRKGMASGINAPDNGLFLTNLINLIFFFILMVVLIVLEGMPPLLLGGIFAFVVAGLLTSYFGRNTYFTAIQHLGPSRASGFRVVTPFFTLVVSLFWLGETVSPIGLVGMAITVVGLYLLSQESARTAEQRTTPATVSTLGEKSGPAVSTVAGKTRSVKYGMSMSLISSIAYGAGHTLRKVGLLDIPSPTFGNLIGSTVGLAGAVATFGAQGQLGAVIRGNLFPIHWWFVAASVVMSLAQLAIFAGIFHTKVAIASTLYSTEPAFTLLFSWLFLNREEKIGRMTVIAIGLTIVGVAMIVQRG